MRMHKAPGAQSPQKQSNSRVDVQQRLNVSSYALRVLEAIDTPVSLSIAMLLKHGEHRQLVTKTVDPRDYMVPSSFQKDYQAVKLLSKGVGLETNIDTKNVALVKFLECEDQCRRVNSNFRLEGFGFSSRAMRIFSNMQRKISSILGELPALEALDFHFGPGASYGTRGDTSVYKKVTSALECTPAMVGTLGDFLSEFPGWIAEGSHDVKIVEGSQLIVVPKNAKTDRPICIEPLLNGLMQSGYGTYIRSRLKRWGIDLKDQGVNQSLAGKAFSEALSTVDFSSASDTISYNLVLNALPYEWFDALDNCRSPQYEIEGAWYNFHKFSSMGNSYTFELESLLFFSLALCVCEELNIDVKVGTNLSVYGDDVIIPRDAFDLFSEISEVLGFSVNLSKSFKLGSFFESCGHDYFNGTYVRPIILSRQPNKLTTAFYYANTVKRIYQLGRNSNQPFTGLHGFGATSQLLNQNAFIGVHNWVVGCIAPYHRCVGPEGYGDGHLIGQLPKVAVRPKSGCETWDGWWFFSYTDRAKRVDLVDSPLGYALYFCRTQPTRESWVLDTPEPLDNGTGYSIRGITTTHRQKLLCHFEWPEVSW